MVMTMMMMMMIVFMACSYVHSMNAYIHIYSQYECDSKMVDDDIMLSYDDKDLMKSRIAAQYMTFHDVFIITTSEKSFGSGLLCREYVSSS